MVGAHAPLSTDAELQGASWAAARGAAVGASKWALLGGGAALIGQHFSPLYRGLTIQFKVFLQMAAMTFGGVIEADRYMRQHGQMMRSRKQMLRDAEVWRRYEEEYGGRQDRP